MAATENGSAPFFYNEVTMSSYHEMTMSSYNEKTMFQIMIWN